MGAWRTGEAVAAAALLLGARAAAAGTVMEPIARLSLEGGYDSNALYDGHSAADVGRVSPEIGLRLHDPTYDLRTSYGGDYVYFQRLVQGGMWNQRGSISLDARPTFRTTFAGAFRLSQAYDPAALAQAGVFRTGLQRATVLGGRARLDWRASELVDAATTFREETVVFQDRTGGAMHAPTVELLQRLDRRWSVGAAYGLGVFQSFAPGPGGDTLSYSNAVRLRARWRAERHLAVDGWVGPALWSAGGKSSLVPEAYAEVLVATRGIDLRLDVSHALGIGATAQPGLVDAFEFGGERRFGRTWFVKGDGGLWRSGTVPSGKYAVTGYAVEAEVGRILAGGLRLSVTGAHFGRTDTAAAAYERTWVGMRVGWALQAR